MAQFLTGIKLEEAVLDLIYNARKRLLIVSPFIKLDEYFRKKVFDKLSGNSELEIIIVFGKNENQVIRSFNRDDFEYFKKFPNISIVYVPNLHAKYYANERESIITSLNLYDTSFKQNIEFGVKSESNLFNTEKIDADAWNKSMEILEMNNVVFVRKPNYRKKLIGKNYIGSTTLHDATQELIEKGSVSEKKYFDFNDLENLNLLKNEPRITREEYEKERSKSVQKEEIITENTKEQATLKGYCIRTGVEIPFDIEKPMSIQAYKLWSKYGNENYPEKFCHFSGEPSYGETSLSKPVLKRNLDKVSQIR